MKNKKSVLVKGKKPSRPKSKTPIFMVIALVTIYLAVGVFLCYQKYAGKVALPFVPVQATAVAPPVVPDDKEPMRRALALDSQSYGLYSSGQYQRSIDLLEESLAIYEQDLESAKLNHDNERERRMETLVAENYQHIGKCYLLLGKQKNEPAIATEHYLAAQRSYQRALPFYQKYGNYPGSTMGEALKDYAELLGILKNEAELEEIKTLARQNHIVI